MNEFLLMASDLFLTSPREEYRKVLDPEDISEGKRRLKECVSEILKVGMSPNIVPSGYCEVGMGHKTGHKTGWLLRSFTGGHLQW